MTFNEIVFDCTKFDSNTTNIQDSKTAWTKRLLSAYTAYLYKIWAVIKTLYDILRRYLYLEHRKLVWMFCSLTFNLYWHIENISLALLSRYISIEYAILLHCKTNNNRNKLIVIIFATPITGVRLQVALTASHPFCFGYMNINHNTDFNSETHDSRTMDIFWDNAQLYVVSRVCF